MFLGLPIQPFLESRNLQELVLLLNTVVLIGALIVVELVYAEKPKSKRQQLRYFYPLVIVLASLLLYAVYTQTGKGA